MIRFGRRKVFEVQWDAATAAWVVRRRNGRRIGLAHARKEDAVACGARVARRAAGLLHRSQLVIRETDGTIGEERTYPDETPRRRG